MKLFLFCACIMILSARPAPTFLVVDKQLKKPVQEAQQFTIQDYRQKHFPVYAAEKETLVTAIDAASKWMDQTTDCYAADTLLTPHTMLIVSTDCDEQVNYSVMLVTEIEESKTSYGFAIVSKEENKRKAQQKILDFAAYLER